MTATYSTRGMKTYPIESLGPISPGEEITVKLDRERGVFRRVDKPDWIARAVSEALRPTVLKLTRKGGA